MRRLTLLLLLVVASCAAPNRADPVTGRPYWSPLGNDFASQDEFIKSNHFTAAYLAMDGGELPEPEIRAVCDAIVKRIAAVVPPTHRRGFSYELLSSKRVIPRRFERAGFEFAYPELEGALREALGK